MMIQWATRKVEFVAFVPSGKFGVIYHNYAATDISRLNALIYFINRFVQVATEYLIYIFIAEKSIFGCEGASNVTKSKRRALKRKEKKAVASKQGAQHAEHQTIPKDENSENANSEGKLQILGTAFTLL